MDKTVDLTDLSDWIFNADVDISEGLVANNSGSSLKITDDYADTAVEVSALSRFASSIVTINASEYSGALDITGNGNGNIIRAAAGGGALDGGGGSDKLYGDEGNDVFVFTGNGRDSVYYYDDGDIVSVSANPTLSKASFFNMGGGKIFFVLGNDTLTLLNSSVDNINVRSEDADGSVEEESFNLAGMRFGSALTNVTVTGDYPDSDFDASDYSRLTDINAASLESGLCIVGNSNDNVISIGSGGGTLDGGEGNDKLYGNSGADVFVHSGGNDTIWRLDGEDDYISLVGVTSVDNSDFLPANNGRIYLTSGNDTVVLVSPSGAVNVHYTDADGTDTEFAFDSSGIYFNINRTSVTLTGDYPDSDFSAEFYSRLEVIDATRNSNPIAVFGNTLDNRISVGAGGGTLDGGTGNDKLYGSGGEDAFVHTIGAGVDTFINFDGENDEIYIYGFDGELSKVDFIPVGGKVSIDFGNDTVAVNNASGNIRVHYGLDDPSETFEFDPSGLIFGITRRNLTLTGDYPEGDFDATDYPLLQNIDASRITGGIELVGNSNNNELRAAQGGSSLDGGTGNDKLYGSDGEDAFVHSVGAGNDTIYNYSGGDALQIYGVGDELDENDFIHVDDGILAIDLGGDTLTLVDYEGDVYVNYGDDDLTDEFTYVDNGSTIAVDRRSVTIGDSYSDESLNAEDLGENLVTIDATRRTSPLDIAGNELDNVISVGSGGGYVDGGEGNDKLYGNSGADTFIHSLGAGRDTLYNYVGTDDEDGDVIQIAGGSELERDAIKFLPDSVTAIDLGDDDTLTLVGAQGIIKVVDDSGSEILTFDSSGIEVVSPKYVVIDGNYNNDTVDAANFSPQLETVTAASNTRGELLILGNSNNNMLRAGEGGTTLDGGTGRDTLAGDPRYNSADAFVVEVGSGDKTILNYGSTSEEGADVIALTGDVPDIDEENFNAVGSNTTLTVGTQKIVLVNPKGPVSVVDENGMEIYTFGLPDGLSLSADGRTLIVTDDYPDTELDLSTLNGAVEVINARAVTGELEIIGNSNKNLIWAPTGGGTLDGGSNNDSLYGGDGIDVFRFSRASGNDTVFNYDSTDEDAPDSIMLASVDSVTKDMLYQSGDKLYLTLGPSRLTISKPQGTVYFIDEDGEELLRFDDEGTSISTDEKYLAIDPDYTDTIFAAANYSTMVATIDARAYNDPLVIEGNSNSNWIRAGSGGSTMDGRGYNDYLYGNSGRDVFRYVSGEGNDYIYNFNSTVEGAGDIIQLLGINGITRSNITDTSNGQTIIRVGTKMLTLVDPIGAISIYGALGEDESFDESFEDAEPMLVYGHSVPSGVSYNFDKTRLTISRSAALDEEEDRVIDISEWSNNLRHVDASDYDYDAITLRGDYKANELRAGHAGSYMDGGLGMDKLYGGEGADTFAYAMGEGNDYIYNFDGTHEDAPDVVQLLGSYGTITRDSFSESGDNTILRVGSQKLTFVNPAGRITVVDEDGEEIIGYSSTLEGGVYYNVGKTILTIGRNAALADSVIDMATLSNNLRNINGSGYSGELYLIGNRRPNELYAGSGGSTLDGRGGNDRLYGGTGKDYFVISVGGGNDVIYNFDGSDEEADVLMLVGGGNISRNSFQDSGNNTFIALGNEKVMLDNPLGRIAVVDEDGNELLTYGQNLPSGVYYTNNKTKLVVGSEADLGGNLTFDVSDYVNNLRDIDASAYEGEDGIILIGDGKANELRAGSGGASMNGGLGNDKLYGGEGADTYIYTVGEGNDRIYNFDGRQGDFVQLYGVGEISRSDFRDANGNVVLRLGTNTLTFVNPTGPITFTDSEGNTMETTYEDELPVGVSYNSNKTKLTIGREADLGSENELDMATLSNNIRDIDATYYEGYIVVRGNDKSNEIRAGEGGSSLDGGTGNDKLYGGAGADTYVVSVGSGNDMIYNYNGDDGDVIEVIGVDTLSGSNFQDSSQNVFLNFGSQRILINRPTGTITVRYGNDDDHVITYGGTLPRGVTYSSDKRTLTINRGAEVEEDTEFDMETLSNSLLNIDATYFDDSLYLKGNSGANELHAPTGGSTLDGGGGSDKLYGGDGADVFIYRAGEGSDHIYNYNGDDEDVIQISGVSALDEDDIRESGQNISIKIGNNRLTLVRPTGQLTIQDENGDELLTYNNGIPDGVIYNQSRTKLTVTNAAELGDDDNLLDMATLSNNLRDIDASDYEGEIIMKGNGRQNELRAGTAGSSMDGGRGNDKLYGGDGADTYAYTVGEGNDYIYNYDGADGDVIQLRGNVAVDESSFRDNGTNVVLTVGSNRLTLVDPQGQIVVVDEDGSTIATHNEALPEGVRYNRSKTKLIVEAGAELDDDEMRVSNFVESLRDIDASAYNDELELIGDEKANELYLGSGGGTLEGGGGNDNLYGGAGVDMFRYTEGDGNDYIYNYDSTSEDAADVLQLLGVSGVDLSDFRDSGRNTILTVGTQRITFVNPHGQIIVVDDNDEEIIRYGAVLPEGVNYNNAKTKLTVNRSAELTGDVLDMSTLSSNLKEIDASSYGEYLTLIGNSKSNVLRAGSGGSSLDGGAGNDKLYGGIGADVFAYTVDEGSDKIYNFGAGDMIELHGAASVDRTMFKESGKNTVLTVGNNRLTIVNSPGLAISVQADGSEEPFVYGADLSEGMSYNGTKTKLTVNASADLSGNEGVLRVENYVNNLKDINASGYGEEIALIGDDKANELRAGSGGSTLSGGGGNDKLYGGSGADVFVYSSGGDEIYNYDPDEDTVSLDGGRVTSAHISGNDIVYNIGTGSLTLKNVAVYGLMAINFASGSSQLAAEEYWFESAAEGDPLSDIMDTRAALGDDFVVDRRADELGALRMKVTATRGRRQ